MKIETVKDPKQGIGIAKRVLYKNVDPKTVLFLSGGATPEPLYKLLAGEKKLSVGAVAMVDDRYGEPFHKDSNEKMVRDTGLVNYLSSKNILFYSILNPGYSLGSNLSNLGGSNANVTNVKRLLRLRQLTDPRNDIEDITEGYGEDVDYLLSYFPKRIAIMGIGEDGHIAGLPAKSQISNLKSQIYVIRINDFPGEFRERITLTFKALSEMNLLIVLVFGEKKKRALELMFIDGSIEEVPARFYKRPDIAKKTILITDQKV